MGKLDTQRMGLDINGMVSLDAVEWSCNYQPITSTIPSPAASQAQLVSLQSASTQQDVSSAAERRETEDSQEGFRFSQLFT